LRFCNPGAPCTQEQIRDFIGNVPIRQPLPATVYYLFDQRQTNVLNLAVRGLDISASYAYFTENAGSFTASMMATDFLIFDESFSGSPKFSVLNTSGYNTTFPSIALQAGMAVRWDMDVFSAGLFARYIGGYRNWSSTAINPVITASADGQSVPVGGGDPVKANVTLDAHVSYNLARLGRGFGDSQVYLDISNLLGTDPPFYNTGAPSNSVNSTMTGFDPYGASNLGRVFSVGVRLKY
jgi:iron complex outermembrane receptor protein